MSEKLESAIAFKSALTEVELLLSEAESAAPGKQNSNEQKYSVMNKSAVLLLAGKFEAFLESTVEDYLFAINTIGAKACFLPTRILAEHSVNAIRLAEQKLNNGDIESIKNIFTTLGRYWNDLDICNKLEVSCKFNYGKHGEYEVVKLFKRIGIDDVFSKITITGDSTEAYEEKDTPVINIKGIFNSLSGIRNNILHQDDSPSLTPEYLRNQTISLIRFADALVNELQSAIDLIERMKN